MMRTAVLVSPDISVDAEEVVVVHWNTTEPTTQSPGDAMEVH
jgi:hypothetical protein